MTFRPVLPRHYSTPWPSRSAFLILCVYCRCNVHILGPEFMRTNIVIDEKLMAEALRLTGIRTKRRVVEDSLRLMIQMKHQERIRAARGKLAWSGDLEAMRRDR